VYEQTAGLDGCVSVHGLVTGNTIDGSYGDAHRVLQQLAGAGIDFGDVTELLEPEGLATFEKSWRDLNTTIATELRRLSLPQ
jgi:transaldolase